MDFVDKDDCISDSDHKIKLKAVVSKVHHQVANTFQNLCSLIQISERNSQESKTSLKLINRHVQSFADLHELLKESSDEQVDISRLLEKIVSRLQSDSGIKIEQNESVMLSLEAARSFSVICNELLSEILKYGAKDLLINLDCLEQEALLTVSVNSESLQIPANSDSFDLVNLLSKSYFGSALESDTVLGVYRVCLRIKTGAANEA